MFQVLELKPGVELSPEERRMLEAFAEAVGGPVVVRLVDPLPDLGPAPAVPGPRKAARKRQKTRKLSN